MSLRSAIVAQFRRPHGSVGALAGWIMQTRSSNRRRNQWTVDLLEIRPDDRVLEVGCGPGLALAACAARAVRGHVVGLDHSATMIGQARKRLGRMGLLDRTDLVTAGIDAVPDLAGPFDKVYSLNVVQFLPDTSAFAHTLFAALAPGGLAATTYMPRNKNPTRADALALAERVREAMAEARFTDIRIEELLLEPVPAVCVLGVRPCQGPA